MSSVYVYSPSLSGAIVFRDSSILDVTTTIGRWRQSGNLTTFTRGNPDDGIQAAMMVDFGRLPAVTIMVDAPPASLDAPVWDADSSF